MNFRPIIRTGRVTVLLAAAVVSIGTACAGRSALTTTPAAVSSNARVLDEARAFMSAYAADLRAGNRAALADRYDRNGAYLLGNGEKELTSYDALIALYRGPKWTPPASFEWRDLSFEATGPDAVVVVGRFSWTGAVAAAPLEFSYTALLRRQHGVLRIRVEDESFSAGTDVAASVAAFVASPTTTSTFDIPSGDATIRARFFAAQGGRSIATVLIVPGWGGDSLDAAGMGALLSARRVNVLLMNFRGVQQSSGRFTYANAVNDIGAAWRWLRQPENGARYSIDTTQLALAGNSFGGAVAMVYSAGDTTVQRVISIVGADHGVLARRVKADSAYASQVRGQLASAEAPRGAIRFDAITTLRDIVRRERENDLVALAPRFSRRAVLLVGGWSDTTAPIERDILPVYRALVAHPNTDATLLAYPEGHSLRTQRDRVADDIRLWLTKRLPK